MLFFIEYGGSLPNTSAGPHPKSFFTCKHKSVPLGSQTEIQCDSTFFLVMLFILFKQKRNVQHADFLHGSCRFLLRIS